MLPYTNPSPCHPVPVGSGSSPLLNASGSGVVCPANIRGWSVGWCLSKVGKHQKCCFSIGMVRMSIQKVMNAPD